MAGANPYLATQVMTASPHRLHLLVVEGAIRHAMQAEEAFLRADWDVVHLALGHCRDFVTELIGGLDETRDADLGRRMKQLFFCAYLFLAEGERDRELKKVQDALAVLRSHHETWLELGRRLQAANPQPPSTPSQAWSA